MISSVEAIKNTAILQARRRLAGESIAAVVTIEVTYRCNLRCRHCYIGPYTHNNGKPQDNELSTSEMCDLLDQLFDSGTFFVDFTGGEAFCRPDFFEIMEHARKIGLFFGIKTNGTMITAEVADRLKELGISGVHFSLYGATAATHEFVTCIPGSLARTLEAIKLLKERQIRVGINTTMIKCNVHEHQQLKELGKELGIKTSFTPIIFSKIGQPGSADDIRLEDSQLKDLILSEGWGSNGSCREFSSGELRHHILCSACRNRCAISPVGDVMPCVTWRRPLGNLRQQNFTDIWQGEAAGWIRSLDISDFPVCASCELARYCARCPGIMELENENGGFSGPSSINCRMARAIKEVRDARGKEALR